MDYQQFVNEWTHLMKASNDGWEPEEDHARFDALCEDVVLDLANNKPDAFKKATHLVPLVAFINSGAVSRWYA